VNSEGLARANSDILQGKDVEVMKLQVELAGAKLARDCKEEEFARELNAIQGENSRLKVQLEAAKLEEICLRNALEEITDTVKTHVNTIETLTNDKESLLKKVHLLEEEVYSEKQHSSEVQHATSEALKQLLASKSLCESDLEALKEQHLRCITNSSKVEQNLRAQIAEVMAECQLLREKQPIPVEVQELARILEQKEAELAVLQGNITALEEKWLKTSAQLAQERSQYFESKNQIYQENETLRHENELLKQEKSTETYNFEEIHRQIQLYELQLQAQTELKAQVSNLQETITTRDLELHRRQVELETQRVTVRGLEDKLRVAQEKLEDKLEAQKSEEAQFICELTKEKLEAERRYFAEIENRARMEDRLYSREKAFQQLEEEYKALLEVAKTHARNNPKRRSYQSNPNQMEASSPFKSHCPARPFLDLEDVKEPAPVPIEAGEVQSPPNEMQDRPRNGTKEAYMSGPCNCMLW
jgi:hypothetical protein